MAYWFIRLGGKDSPEDRELYQALAREHSIVKIGYYIDKDLTNKSKEEIKEYFVEKNEKNRKNEINKINKKYKKNTIDEINKLDEKNRIDRIHEINEKNRKNEIKELDKGNKKILTNNQIGSIAGLVDSFINTIEIGDTIISPFDGGNMKIGEVTTNCKTLESLFEDEYEDKAKDKLYTLLEKHPGDKKQGSQEYKPARRVKWLTDEMSLYEFPESFQKELNKSMPKTITSLSYEALTNLSESYDPKIIVLEKIAEVKKAFARIEKVEKKFNSMVLENRKELTENMLKNEKETKESIRKYRIRTVARIRKMEKDNDEKMKRDKAKTASIAFGVTILTTISTAIINKVVDSCVGDNCLLGIDILTPNLLLALIGVASAGILWFILWKFNEELGKYIGTKESYTLYFYQIMPLLYFIGYFLIPLLHGY